MPPTVATEGCCGQGTKPPLHCTVQTLVPAYERRRGSPITVTCATTVLGNSSLCSDSITPLIQIQLHHGHRSHAESLGVPRAGGLPRGLPPVLQLPQYELGDDSQTDVQICLFALRSLLSDPAHFCDLGCSVELLRPRTLCQRLQAAVRADAWTRLHLRRHTGRFKLSSTHQLTHQANATVTALLEKGRPVGRAPLTRAQVVTYLLGTNTDGCHPPHGDGHMIGMAGYEARAVLKSSVHACIIAQRIRQARAQQKVSWHKHRKCSLMAATASRHRVRSELV